MIKIRNFTLALFVVILGYISTPAALHSVEYPNFRDNPHLTAPMRERMAPFLLPLDHPMKPRLDAIFSQSRVIENASTLVDAGFSIIAGPMPVSFIVVARHPEIPGYVFKIYLDSETRRRKEVFHWQSLTMRCSGAMGIRKIIEREKITHFVVPDKWLYVLPPQPFYDPKNHHPVLVMETDMELAGQSVTREKWRTAVTRKTLDELYLILKEGNGGNGATFLVANVPYTKHGKFAFTDTESPHKMDLRNVKAFLSKEMGLYWDKLIGNRKKK